MTDRSLRDLERRWQQTGGRADGVALLQARLRAGDLTKEQLELASFLGSPIAVEILGNSAWDCPRDLRGVLRGLSYWGNEAVLRGLAAALDLTLHADPEARERARGTIDGAIAGSTSSRRGSRGSPGEWLADEIAACFVAARDRPMHADAVIDLLTRRVREAGRSAVAREQVGRSMADWVLRSPDGVSVALDEPEARPVAAAEFVSSSRFRVLVENDHGELREVGRTPTASAIVLPPARWWWVRPPHPDVLRDPAVRQELERSAAPGLHLGHEALNLRALDAAALVPTLRWLCLRGARALTVPQARALARLSTLEHLDLGLVDLQPGALAELAGHATLRSLDLRRKPPAPGKARERSLDDDLRLLSTMPLRALSLRDERLMHRDLEVIGGMSTLEELNLRRCFERYPGTPALQSLARLPRLRRLDLAACVGLYDEPTVLAHLADAPALRRVFLPRTTAGHEAQAQRLLPRCDLVFV